MAKVVIKNRLKSRFVLKSVLRNNDTIVLNPEGQKTVQENALKKDYKRRLDRLKSKVSYSLEGQKVEAEDKEPAQTEEPEKVEEKEEPETIEETDTESDEETNTEEQDDSQEETSEEEDEES